MQETILIFWILIWVIFLIMSYLEKRGNVFGFLAGLWILFLGIFLYIDGIQVESGMTIVDWSGGQNITYVFNDVVLPYSNHGILWGVPFVCLSIYILWLAATKKVKGVKK